MKLLILIFLFFISACISNNFKNDVKMDDDFNKILNFNDYKIKLDKYTKNSTYPKIND
tara:strand:+ start:50 stop:223 length:174 start_codon:yes stop_codon:yes gene_type:complete